MSKKPIISTAIDVNPTSNSVYAKLLEEQITKILSTKTTMSRDELSNELRTHHICASQEDLNNALYGLRKKGWIPNSCKGTNIFLSNDKQDEICFKYKEFETTKKKVIKQYFTDGITCKDNIVNSWLDKILTTVFEQYYVVVLSRVTNKSDIDLQKQQQLDIKSNHNEIAKELKIPEDDSNILLSQLERMFSSYTDTNVTSVFNYYLNTCYATQILSSKTYASLSIADMFRDKTIILDTNILIALKLEQCHQEHVKLSVIEDVCTKLGITLKCLPQTLSEYKNVVDYKKDVYSDVLLGVSQRVLEKAKEDNIFHTLRKKGYYTVESVKHFFTTYLRIPPQSLVENGTAIAQIPNSECNAIFEYYSSKRGDLEMLRTVFSSYLHDDFEQEDGDGNEASEKRIIKKSERVAQHDLGLIGYVRTKRGTSDLSVKYSEKVNDNVILLTMDSSLVAYAKSQYPEKDFVYNIRDVITLLALDKGGLLGNPDDFVPMLRNFVNTNFMIWDDTFDIKDLSHIMTLERWVSSLDDADVIRVSKEIHKMRKSNSPKIDIHEYIQCELNYEYNLKNRQVNELTDKNNEQAQMLKEQTKKMQEKDDEIVSLKEENKKLRLREFSEKFEDENSKRNCRKSILNIIGVITIIALALFFICIVVAVLSKCDVVAQYFEKYESIASMIVFLSDKLRLFISIDVVSLVLAIVKFVISNRLEKKEYFKKESIKEYVLNNLKLDREVEDYIRNGFNK